MSRFVLLLGILLGADRVAAEALPVVAPSDVHAVPGQSIGVPVTTSQSMNVGSTDVILHFDTAILEAVTADSRLDGFRFTIDGAQGLVATASATGGTGQALGAGDALMQVTFRVRADAPAGCTPLTITDADGASPDDVAGPVPPIPPVAIPYEAHAGSVCVAVCTSCDDDDSCTADACDQAVGSCVHTDAPAGDPASVSCRVANFRRVVTAPPLPVCRQTCPQTFEKQLAKIEKQLAKGLETTTAPRCRLRLRTATRTAKALERHVVRFAAHGGFVPADRGTRLGNEATLLTNRLKTLTTTRCARGAS